MSSSPSRGLHLGLWAVQVLLALAFLGGGSMKLLTPVDELAKNMAWVTHAPAFLPKFVGLSEVLGALGLILPSALRIQPKLTALAAALLAVVMLLAVGTHVSIGEAAMSAPALVLGLLAAFVAWGRGVAAPIAPKG